MLRLRILVISLFIINIIFVSPVTASGQKSNPIMPTDLIQIAKKSGCEPIKDFFVNEKGPVKSPYAYHPKTFNENLKSDFKASFWCQIGRDTFSLVFVGLEGQMAKCANKINVSEFFPGGLTVVPPEGIKFLVPKEQLFLRNYLFLDKKTYGPDKYWTHDGIYTHRPGFGAFFYCHEGRWMRYMLD